MNKTYTLQKTQVHEVAKNQAAINYYLVDDKGNQRVVPAVAKLGFSKKPKQIRAKYYRETPLVEALAQAKQLQQVEVSYTKFNKHPRISLLPEDRNLSDVSLYSDNFYNGDVVLDKKMRTPNFLTLGLFTLLAVGLWIVFLSMTAV